MACWEEPHQERWLILPDLPPESRTPQWYALRAWVEHGFKVLKRGGFQWQRTRRTAPDRAARLWLGVAIAPLWVLSVGGAAAVAATPEPVFACPALPPRTRRATRLRLVGCFRQGWTRILAALLDGRRLPVGRFWPDPGPDPPPLLLALPAAPLPETYP